jgi:hypothetical protein
VTPPLHFYITLAEPPPDTKISHLESLSTTTKDLDSGTRHEDYDPTCTKNLL